MNTGKPNKIEISYQLASANANGITYLDLLGHCRNHISSSRAHEVFRLTALRYGMVSCTPPSRKWGGVRLFRSQADADAWLAKMHAAELQKTAPKPEEPEEQGSKGGEFGRLSRFVMDRPSVPGWGGPPPIRDGAMDYKQHMAIGATRHVLLDLSSPQRPGWRE